MLVLTNAKIFDRQTTGLSIIDSLLEGAWGRVCYSPGPASTLSLLESLRWSQLQGIHLASTVLLHRAIWYTLISLVSRGPSQSDSTLPTRPCFPWFPNSGLGFKPSGLLMVRWENIPGSFTEFLRPAMALLLLFWLVGQCPVSKVPTKFPKPMKVVCSTLEILIHNHGGHFSTLLWTFALITASLQLQSCNSLIPHVYVLHQTAVNPRGLGTIWFFTGQGHT